MRVLAVIALVNLVGCAPSPRQGGEAIQSIRGVCAPTVTRSGEAFVMRVQGGCDGNPDAYRCQVQTGPSRVDVRLMGPACEGCQCTIVDKACSVPPLEEGVWRFGFAEGSAFDRDVEAAPGHPVFVCGCDGGNGCL